MECSAFSERGRVRRRGGEGGALRGEGGEANDASRGGCNQNSLCGSGAARVRIGDVVRSEQAPSSRSSNQALRFLSIRKAHTRSKNIYNGICPIARSGGGKMSDSKKSNCPQSWVFGIFYLQEMVLHADVQGGK